MTAKNKNFIYKQKKNDNFRWVAPTKKITFLSILSIAIILLGGLWFLGAFNQEEDFTSPPDYPFLCPNDKFVISPDTLTFHPGEAKQVAVVYQNLDELLAEGLSFYITPLRETGGKAEVDCEFVDTMDKNSPEFTLRPNAYKRLSVLVKVDSKSGKGSFGCLLSSNDVSARGTLTVNVV